MSVAPGDRFRGEDGGGGGPRTAGLWAAGVGADTGGFGVPAAWDLALPRPNCPLPRSPVEAAARTPRGDACFPEGF